MLWKKIFLPSGIIISLGGGVGGINSQMSSEEEPDNDTKYLSNLDKIPVEKRRIVLRAFDEMCDDYGGKDLTLDLLREGVLDIVKNSKLLRNAEIYYHVRIVSAGMFAKGFNKGVLDAKKACSEINEAYEESMSYLDSEPTIEIKAAD